MNQKNVKNLGEKRGGVTGDRDTLCKRKQGPRMTNVLCGLSVSAGQCHILKAVTVRYKRHPLPPQ